jgi:transcriptional regulator with XRE-family HTH domain
VARIKGKLRDDIIDRIIALRKSLNLSQRALSIRIGMADNTIGDIERRKRSATLLIIKKISEQCGVPLAYFFTDSDQAEDVLYQGIPPAIVIALKLYSKDLSPEAYAEILMFINFIAEREKAKKNKEGN